MSHLIFNNQHDFCITESLNFVLWLPVNWKSVISSTGIIYEIKLNLTLSSWGSFLPAVYSILITIKPHTVQTLTFLNSLNFYNEKNSQKNILKNLCCFLGVISLQIGGRYESKYFCKTCKKALIWLQLFICAFFTSLFLHVYFDDLVGRFQKTLLWRNVMPKRRNLR